MRGVRRALVVLGLLAVACGRNVEAPVTHTRSVCPAARVAVRVLGSGGPIVDDARASTGYLLIVDGRPRLLIDAGGGVALRLGELGVRPESLDAWLISHVHVDHSADLIALLKSASFSPRREALPIVGPSGDTRFPAIEPFLQAQIGQDGAWRYLSAFFAESRPFALDVREASVEGEPFVTTVGDLRIEAVGVPHGPVPALGFVVHAAGKRVAFGGDQRLDDPRFLALARDADLLIAHHAVPEKNAGIAARLHARPSQIGAFAHEARVRRLVLSHHMRRSLDRWTEGEAALRARYDGPLELANDLDCFAVR
ncbi:MAG: MBL fold metallo-hydrolase [Sandaracinus sp.]|nr:MBL fold metallo-hydrolase [Sandaracinus sp.]MCB9633328.1 MBL fold metallo-hydrolase [Sandaracinus sp.]